MVKQYCIPLEAPSEWNEALKGIKHSFGQTWENCYAMHLTTGFKTYLYCFEGEHGRMVCPIAEREYDGYIDIVKPFGFSGFVGNGNCSEFAHFWREFVKEKGYVCGYLGLDPIFFDSSHHFASEGSCQYDTIHVLDLTLSHDELFANLSRNRKRQLRGWDDILPNFVSEKSTLVDFYLENHVDFFRRKNALPFYFFSRDTLSFLFSLDNVILVGVRDSEKVVAVIVFTYTADVSEALFTVSLPEEEHHLVSMYWYGVSHLKSLQIPLLNLGGGRTNLADFKRRFGGNQFVLKCVKQIYRPEIYEQLCRQANVNPNDMAGYFPAYRNY